MFKSISDTSHSKSYTAVIVAFGRKKNSLKMDDKNKNSKEAADPVAPSWIKSHLFVGILKEIEPEFLSIEEFNVGGALSPGENYASIMLKVDIVIKLKGNLVILLILEFNFLI